MQGQLFVLSAPSGAGKSTIANALQERMADLGHSVSHTSRPPRGNEKEGVHYHFVDRKIFSRMVDEEASVEWARVYDHFYGTAFSSLNSLMTARLDVLLDLDAQGAKNIKKHYENSVLIYILPPSISILEKRLKGRGTDHHNIIKMRMERAKNDIKNCVWYDYIIINDDLEKAIEEVQSIVMSERCRAVRRAPTIKNLYNIP